MARPTRCWPPATSFTWGQSEQPLPVDLLSLPRVGGNRLSREIFGWWCWKVLLPGRGWHGEGPPVTARKAGRRHGPSHIRLGQEGSALLLSAAAVTCPTQPGPGPVSNCLFPLTRAHCRYACVHACACVCIRVCVCRERSGLHGSLQTHG